jgi:transcriptional regulator with XRE-family HTH domain
MTPKQLGKLLASAGLSQRAAARELAISERNMRRYVAGELPVPKTVELALRYLQRKPADIDSLNDEERLTVEDGRRELRELRPGKRPIAAFPFRNAADELIEVRYAFSDSPAKLTVGRWIKLPSGSWGLRIP